MSQSLTAYKTNPAKLDVATFVSQAALFIPEYIYLRSAWTEHVPFAFWIVETLRPHRFVELGTHYGVSHLAFCQAVRSLGLETECYAVDTWRGDEHAGFYDESVFLKIKEIHDPSFGHFSQLIRSSFDEAVRYFEDSSIDLLHIDGFHTYNAVKHDFETWVSKLRSPAIVLFHDTNVREADFGVFRLWNELTKQHAHFSFVHGHGLGVLGIGSGFPPAIADLFAASNNTEATKTVRDIFSRLGYSLPLVYRATYLKDKTERLSAELENTSHAVPLTARVGEVLTAVETLSKQIDTQQVALQTANNERFVYAEKLTHVQQASTMHEAIASTLRGQLSDLDATRAKEYAEIRAALAARDADIIKLLAQLTAVSERNIERILQLMPTRKTGEIVRAAARQVRRGARRTAANARRPLHPTILRFAARHRFGMHLICLLDSPSRRLVRDVWRLRDNPLFDERSYLAQNARKKIKDPILHYLRSGAKKGKNPCYLFNTKWYLEQNPDVEKAGINPLIHYIDFGAHEGRNPSPLFDGNWYFREYPDVASARTNPLLHYLKYGKAEGRKRKSEEREEARVLLQTLQPTDDFLAHQVRMSREMPAHPVISVLVPVYRIPPDVFQSMVKSVLDQSYPFWELCLAVTPESGRDIVSAAHRHAQRDPRVKIHTLAGNGGISRNSNAALSLATGPWCALLDHDDILAPDALFEIARAINRNPGAALIYTDKDTINPASGDCVNTLLKPAWSPEIMLSANYLTHLCAMRTARLREIGGWDHETDGAQDWDLFLRVIDHNGIVEHIAKTLYHWQMVGTSVASLGTRAKPFVLQAQLRALQKYLVATWPGATPEFQDGDIRIRWSADWRPSVSIILIGAKHPPNWLRRFDSNGFEVLAGSGTGQAAQTADDLISRASGDVIVMIDGGYEPCSTSSIDELIGPLQNYDIDLVGGKVLGPGGRVLDFGLCISDGKDYPMFRGEEIHHWGLMGSLRWYRNASTAAGGCLAFRRKTWKDIGGFAPLAEQGRADVLFCLRCASTNRGRLMLNPFALFQSAGPCAFETEVSNPKPPMASPVRGYAISRDPYVNPRLELLEGGCLSVRDTRARPPSGHDFCAEATCAASCYDITQDEIDAAKRVAPHGPLKRVAWFIPDFQVAHYGGIFTILRAADYMWRAHSIKSVFVVVGGSDASAIRARIAGPFADLALNADIVSSPSGTSSAAIGAVDAAVATLWTTAYSVVRQPNVRRRFYFLQDWESLFYPAGTLSALVEATYRFGFHAICNTPALAESYRALGGTADYFVPAVDLSLFHPRTTARERNDPFSVFSYMRPSHPRNCFQAIAQGLTEVKRRHGEAVRIFAAGATWDPVDYNLEGVVTNLGLLPYEDTGLLYRTIDAGLVAMATRHPSYLPLELMACGAAVVTNRNPCTSWLLRDGKTALLCEMTRTSIADAIDNLIRQPSLRDRLAEAGIRVISENHSDWNRACQRIYAVLSCEVEGKPPPIETSCADAAV